MNCQPISPISFGYHHKLKDYYKKGLFPSVKKDLYGSELTPKIVTLEHILPHSQGGKTVLSNLALATANNNMMRGNDDIRKYLSKQAANEYLDQFVDVKIKNFNGNNYKKVITETLRKLGLDL